MEENGGKPPATAAPVPLPTWCCSQARLDRAVNGTRRVQHDVGAWPGVVPSVRESGSSCMSSAQTLIPG